MALFDGSLEDVLGQQAKTKEMGVEQGFAKKRKQVLGQQAASGRLSSGVANYPLADLGAEEVDAYGDVYSGLSDSLGQITSDDFVASNQYERDRELAKLIGKLNNNRGSVFSRVIGGGTRGAAAGGAAGGPWGALGGGIGGSVAGAFS